MIKLFRRNTPPDYSDVELVEGMRKGDKVMEEVCYNKCKTYFYANYRAVFFDGDELKDDIFQESYVIFWNNLECGDIRVEDGELKGKDGKPFRSSLTTYLMGIAKRKYKEITRPEPPTVSLTDGVAVPSVTPDSEEKASDIMSRIIDECISVMSERCRQIISLFYHKEKTLDMIMEELTSFKSKDALKTAKYKCMETLKKCSNDMYEQYLNS